MIAPTRSDLVRVRLLSTVALVVSLASACSGPTAPTQTPPTTVQPPSTPPTLSLVCPTNISVTTFNTSEAITFAEPTVSGGTPPVEVSCTRQSGSLFPSGRTSVLCTARDGASQSTSCSFDVTVNTVARRISRTAFLAFGDSLTSGEVSQPIGSTFRLIVVPSAAYPTHLQEMLRARYTAQPTIQVTNAGRPGEWAQDSIPRFQGLLGSLRPEVVILLHGYNDLGAQDSAGAVAAARAVETMARDARLRGARVFVASLPPPQPNRTHSLPSPLVTSYNNQLRSIALGEGAVFVDIFAGLVNDVPRYIGIDGLHPTEAGYFRMAELFFNAIRGDLELPLPPQ